MQSNLIDFADSFFHDVQVGGHTLNTFCMWNSQMIPLEEPLLPWSTGVLVSEGGLVDRTFRTTGRSKDGFPKTGASLETCKLHYQENL